MNSIVTVEEILDNSISYYEIETSAPPETGRTNRRPTRWHCDRGEGVISTAIAVLIMAFLGATMWVAFNTIWSDAETNIKTQIQTINTSSP